jgi:hypothetical protein
MFLKQYKMERKEYQTNALNEFRKQYCGTETSGDLQAFVFGWIACEKAYLKKDNKKWVIKNLDLKDCFIHIVNETINNAKIDMATYFNSFEEAEGYMKIYYNRNWEIKELFFKTFSI